MTRASAAVEGAELVGVVVHSTPKFAKIALSDNTVGFMPAREAPFSIRDSQEERASGAAAREVRRYRQPLLHGSL